MPASMATPPRIPNTPIPGRRNTSTRRRSTAGSEEKDPLGSGEADDEVGTEEEREGQRAGRTREPQARRLDLHQEPEEAQGKKEGRHHRVGEEADRPLRPVHPLDHHVPPLEPQLRHEGVPVLHHGGVPERRRRSR
jgi:hypothetical protein